MRSTVMASTVSISFSDNGRRDDLSASRKRLSYRRPARSLASVPLNRHSPLISENCIVKWFTMYHCVGFVKLRVGGNLRAAESLPVLGRDGGGASQEIRDQLELLFRIAGKHLARRPPQAGKDGRHLRVFGRAAEDHDPSTVEGVVHAPDPAAALESIEDRRDGAGGQPNSLRKLPRRHRPEPTDDIHTLSISAVHSQAVGNCLVHQVQFAVQGSDFL